MTPKSLLIPLALLALFGCKKAGEPFTVAAATTPEAGWTKATDAESGLSLDLPPGWRVGMPKGQGGGFASGSGYSSNPTVSDAMGSGGGGMPAGMPDMGDTSSMGADAQKMAAEMAAENAKQEKVALTKLREQGIFIQAVNDANGTIGEEPTRFYLQQYKDAGNLEAMKAQEHESMMSEGDGEAVTLPVGKAWMLQNKGQNRIGDQERHVTYVICDGTTGYALRFVSTNNPKVFDDFHRQVAKSLRKAK